MTLMILAPCCLTVSFPVLSKAASEGQILEGSWQIKVAHGVLHKLLGGFQSF